MPTSLREVITVARQLRQLITMYSCKPLNSVIFPLFLECLRHSSYYTSKEDEWKWASEIQAFLSEETSSHISDMKSQVHTFP